MRKTSVLFVCMIALVAFAAWAPNAEAFGPNADVTDCLICHDAVGPPPPTFAGGSGSPAHSTHLPRMASNCFACHVNIGDVPAASTCAACHPAPDLALFHANADPLASVVILGLHHRLRHHPRRKPIAPTVWTMTTTMTTKKRDTAVIKINSETALPVDV